jgi:hypothetical protein
LIVIITGSQLWPDKDIVWQVMDEVYKEALAAQKKIPKKYRDKFPFDVGFEMYNGECDRGADLFARQWYEYAEKEGYQVTYRGFPAQWDRCSDLCPPDFIQRRTGNHHPRYGQFGPYCPTAGIARSRDMILEAAVNTPKHYVPGICVPFVLNDSHGSIHCARLAKRKGFQLRPYRMGTHDKKL